MPSKSWSRRIYETVIMHDGKEGNYSLTSKKAQNGINSQPPAQITMINFKFCNPDLAGRISEAPCKKASWEIEASQLALDSTDASSELRFFKEPSHQVSLTHAIMTAVYFNLANSDLACGIVQASCKKGSGEITTFEVAPNITGASSGQGFSKASGTTPTTQITHYNKRYDASWAIATAAACRQNVTCKQIIERRTIK